MNTPEIRKLLVAGFDQVMRNHGYSRRRKAEPFAKDGQGWRLTVALDATITYARVKGVVVFRGTIESFEARLAEVIGPELHGQLITTTFLENNRTPENPLLELHKGADDIPDVLELIERSLLEVEEFIIRASEDPSVLVDARGVNLLRRGFACWEGGNPRRALSLVEEARAKGSPELRRAAERLLEHLTT